MVKLAHEEQEHLARAAEISSGRKIFIARAINQTSALYSFPSTECVIVLCFVIVMCFVIVIVIVIVIVM